ncbi:MAG: hypothetical protein K2Y26_17885 [Gemmatimonadaceae bacterium]|nr:hypothetical protein [Gemmatimonadaceae bacterium]
MTIDPKDQVTVSLPVAGVLTPAEIEQSMVTALEMRVIQRAAEASELTATLHQQIAELGSDYSTAGEFTREKWLTVKDDLFDAASAFTRIAVAISTSLAARDALIHQNTSRAPETALERDA